MKKPFVIISILVAGLILAVLIGCATGAVSVSPAQLVAILGYKLGLSSADGFTPQQETVIWDIRLPRVMLSVLAGAILSLSGAAVQGLFRNPLADPGIIGISAGAAMFASIVIVLAGSAFTLGSGLAGFSFLTLGTFAGAILASMVVFGIGKSKRGTSVAHMLLGGIAITAIAGSVTGLLTYLSTDAQLRSLTFWTMGSLGGADWKNVSIVMVSFTVAFCLLLSMSKALNAFALGEQEAQHLGIHIERTKNTILFVTSAAIGATVAFCGIISFIGLVIPHILRLTGGYDHRFLLPASALGGGILLCLADTLSRTLAAPAEIPVGIITALVGAPVFLFLLIRQKFNIT